MAKSLPVTVNTDLVVPVGNATLKGVQLCAGTDAATVEVFDGTVATGTSIAKLATVANVSAAPLECEVLTTKGISVKLSGTNAKAYIIYE